MQKIGYYKVCTLRGHLGSGRGAEIVFYIVAKDMLSAVNKARNMPGVKHARFALWSKEITREEYIEGRKVSAYYR